MARTSRRQQFINVLQSYHDEDCETVSNKELRNELGWSEDVYNNKKQELVNDGTVTVGRGYSGSVALTNRNAVKKLTVFISYSHVDESLKDELKKHLMPIKHLGLIDDWDDGKIKAGSDWEQHITDNLTSADIILLLISVDFINSDYCHGTELQVALSRHEKKECRVIPVILRDCFWKISKFRKLQAIPKAGKAVTMFDNRDHAMTMVAEAIHDVVVEIGQSSK